jgi:hypothetical protein
MNFEDNLKRFISIDNEIKGLNERIKLLRDNRTELSDNLIDYAIKNNISNKDIRINNEKIKFTSCKIQQPLTFKYYNSFKFLNFSYSFCIDKSFYCYLS